MQFDWTVRVTDIVMIVAIIAGPILAVQITERLRKLQDARNRKIHIFRALMATRAATLTPIHIESLNLVEIEFDAAKTDERAVIDCWRLYLAHLNDHNYSRESWDSRRADLLIDLLYAMSVALGYSYDKAQIKTGAYYPQGYGETENDNLQIRKHWLQVLKGERQIPMRAEVYTVQQPQAPPPPPPPPPAPPKEKGKDDVA